MRVPYSWLTSYVDPGLSPNELAERLTLAGVEVEAVEPFHGGLPGVVAARITAIEPVPGSERLSLVRLDTGGTEASVVCGARNIAAGRVVPLARPGTTLPGGRCIEAARVHGVLSEGMLCSAAELGLEELPDEGGILILEPGTVPGAPVDQLLALDDPVLYLALTPNRADCLGLLGVAYEVAALTGTPVRLPSPAVPEDGEEIGEAARVTVQDYALCPRYTARVIRDVSTGPSPLWMQLRLVKAGIRPINNIVDITNYVMWEYGQPLHAFDYDLLRGGEIIVRPGRPGEKLVTLDGIERELDESVLVIADRYGPVGLAGVMGGENTEIRPATRTVLLEAAWFNPVAIRRAARRYNLPSEASQRFERGINPGWVPAAQDRAAQLMAQHAGGRVLRGIIDLNPAPAQPRRLVVRPYRINEILGVKIAVDEVVSILERLGFAVQRSDALNLAVTVPLRRGDVALEEDVVEEVARLYGYENIPVTLPRGELLESRETAEQRLQALARSVIAACGFYEVITYSFINPAHLETLRLDAGDPRRRAIPVQNPLSEEQGVMRTTLLPGLLRTLQHNFSYREMNQLLFEIGAVYLPRRLPLDELPVEGTRLALAATGQAPEAGWNVPAQPADFFTLKGALEALLRRAGVKRVEFVPAALPFTHSTRSAVVKIGGEEAGYLGQLHPAAAAAWDFPQPVAVAELDLDLLAGAADPVPRVVPLPRYPAAWRDLAVVAPRHIPAAELERCIVETGGGLVERVTLFDLYEGEQIPAGKRSLAYKIVFRRPGGTLTEGEVNAAQERIVAALAALGATLRA